jgi:hypothetical protein
MHFAQRLLMRRFTDLTGASTALLRSFAVEGENGRGRKGSRERAFGIGGNAHGAFLQVSRTPRRRGCRGASSAGGRSVWVPIIRSGTVSQLRVC